MASSSASEADSVKGSTRTRPLDGGSGVLGVIEREDDGDVVKTRAVVEWGDVEFARKGPEVAISNMQMVSERMNAEMRGRSTYPLEDFFLDCTGPVSVSFV